VRAAARLAGFGALLAVVGGAAALAGQAIGPDPGPAAAGDHHDAAPAPPAGAAPAAVGGLAVSDAGHALVLGRTTFPVGRPAPLRFRITGPDGGAVRAFDVEHERRMHLIVVRRDGSGFQHLHPSMAPDGTWTAPLRLAEPGAHRVFADFSAGGRPITLGADLAADGPARSRPLPGPAPVAATAGGYRVALDGAPAHAGAEADLRFTVTRGGRAVRTEPYLGAGGHLVALREGDLAFLHTHPAGHGAAGAGPIAFRATFPTPGRYRLHLQFRAAGVVRTAGFTRAVAR
jgi:hypothetical protein